MRAGDGAGARRVRLRDLMDRRGVAAAVLRRPENFAWYTGGGNSRVEYASPLGVADVVVTPEGECVLAGSIESPRMRSEETRDFTVVTYPWQEGPDRMLRELVGDATVGADVPLPGAVDLAPELAELRRSLDADALDRLRAVGADLGAALGEAAGAVEPGISEHEAAGAIAAACRRRGLVPTVLLAAGDERIRRHRHPLPTAAPVERRAMLVASAQRGGLYANLTRIVWFEEPDPDTAHRQHACDEILARMRDEATRPGRTLGEVFADCRRFYADVGFPDEWRLHHQGGPTGYASREVIATPSSPELVTANQAFAWNPSVTGAKAEETFVLTEAGAEVVTGAPVGAPA